MDVLKTDGPQPLINFLKDLIAIQILWATSLMFIKISILLFYMRIFEVRFFRIAAQATMVFVVLWALSVILCGFLLCRPFAYNWDQSIPGSCGHQILSYILTGALNICTDVMVLSLPIPMVWKLQTDRANKVALTAIFGLGFLYVSSSPCYVSRQHLPLISLVSSSSSVCIVSIVRLITLVSVSYTDITYSVVDALIWSMLEPALGVTLACLPVMRPLFQKVFPARSRNRTKESNNSGFDAKAFDSKNFRRLDELAYPLRPVGNVTTSVVLSHGGSASSKSMPHHVVDDVESQQGSPQEVEPAGPLPGIKSTDDFAGFLTSVVICMVGMTPEYCLVEVASEDCIVGISIVFLVVVIIANALKGGSLLYGYFKKGFIPLATTGDTLSSFLTHPDPITAGLVPLSVLEISKAGFSTTTSGSNRTVRKRPYRWFKAPEPFRWYLGTLSLLLPLPLLGLALYWNIGYPYVAGPQAQSSSDLVYTEGGGPYHNSPPLIVFHHSFTAVAILANLPQLILTGI
ncbi:MAG: hypothetical protein M1830_008779 [Pleopsidium flavum]|nr:MAG: hypothetical protein M1830_008779 [Pleopsidium flavum]